MYVQLACSHLPFLHIANHHLNEGEDDTVHTYCVENLCSSTGILLAYEATWQVLPIMSCNFCVELFCVMNREGLLGAADIGNPLLPVWGPVCPKVVMVAIMYNTNHS